MTDTGFLAFCSTYYSHCQVKMMVMTMTKMTTMLPCRHDHDDDCHVMIMMMITMIRVERGGQPVLGASVKADITGPGGKLQHLRLEVNLNLMMMMMTIIVNAIVTMMMIMLTIEHTQLEVTMAQIIAIITIFANW